MQREREAARRMSSIKLSASLRAESYQSVVDRPGELQAQPNAGFPPATRAMLLRSGWPKRRLLRAP